MRKLTKWILTTTLCLLLCSISAMAAETAEITKCAVKTSDTGKVEVEAKLNSAIAGDDSTLYLFAVPTYADDLAGQTPVANQKYSAAGTYSFEVNLNHNSASSLLYSKFYVAIKSGGKYTAVSAPMYITNPEVLAVGTEDRRETSSKKGLQVSFYIPTDIEDLGIEHGFVNICFENIISNSPTDYSYVYNGQTYYFTSVIADYDTLIGNMTDAGVSVTVALLNEYRAGYEYLLLPGVSPRIGTFNYAINTSTKQGLDTIAATTHFLAERYNSSTSGKGKIENWVIGNEVNDNLQYYYMGEADTDTFVQEYLQSFRVMYTAIKSAYKNANVYVPLQNRWATADSMTDYGGKSFINTFNKYAKQQGDMDWGLAYHPYSFPANDADILNDGDPTIDKDGNGLYGGEVLDSVNSPIITMKNLKHLTNYFHNTDLLNAEGKVRSIILSEQGYTSYSNISGKNEAKQAANIALAYYMSEMNEDVDAFILRGHGDEDEGSEYFMFGLWNTGADGYPTTPKFAYEMYKYLDTSASLSYTEFAKSALNIGDWSDVITGWKASKITSMKERMDASLNTATGVSGGSVIAADMLNVWEAGYNVHGFGVHDHVGNYFPRGLAVTNPYAYYLAYQGIEKEFATALNLSANPYLTFDINFKPQAAADASDKLELRVRLHSGDDVFDANGIINVNTDYKICLDVSKWNGKASVDKLEIWVREYGKTTSFDGTFTLYNLATASSVTGMNALQNVRVQKTDLSTAKLDYEKSFDFDGSPLAPEVTVKVNNQTLVQNRDYDVIYNNNINVGTANITVVGIGSYTGYQNGNFTINGDYPTVYQGVDYAPVYAYGYYKTNNPVVVEEVGTDPEAVLKHFVTKGMKYALQGIGSFNVLAYAKLNDDLPKYYGNDYRAMYIHFLEFGQFENRAFSGTKPDDMEMPEYPAYVSDTEYNGVDYKAVYNSEYYSTAHPDVAAAFNGDTQAMLKHFVEYGMAEGRQGSESFNVYAYKELNPDVAGAFGNDLKSCYMHYVLCGQSEGRPTGGTKPTFKPSAIYNGIDYKDVFNAEYYAQANPDVAAAFNGNVHAMLEHFVLCGMREGRAASEEFNLNVYKQNNPDVAAAYGDDNASYYMHYILCGKAEGRTATGGSTGGASSNVDYSLVFDAAYYAENNTDVKNALGNDANSLLNHFINYGISEGRVASASFNVKVYREKNGDLSIFGDDWAKYFEHYINYGHNENRICK